MGGVVFAVASQSSKLYLNGIVCVARVGVPAGERRRRQRLWVDLTLALDFRKAAEGDDPSRTVDYARVERKVQSVVSARPYRLIEAVAQAVGREILDAFPRIRSLCVRVTKKPKAMPRVSSVTVEMGFGRKK
ncbi:MAG: dihydroneopterin aldolase [Elusimicrobia bacterium]|nr:dihydroneopterin aldolase [Elusimicrobiota bacterium]